MDLPDLILPNEILGAIFNQLPPSSLVQVASVSPQFKAVAERFLYSSINIQDNISIDSPGPWKTLRWCHSIATRSLNLETVRRVHIRWQTQGTPPAPHHFVTFCKRLGHVLQHLTYLESLELFLGPANLIDHHEREPIHAIERVIADCHLPHLRSCSLGAEYTKGAQPYTSVLSHFLINNPNLQHLKIPDLIGRLNLPAGSLPNLSAFRGSADAAGSLLPGRPVLSLALFGDDSTVNRENLPRIACTSIPLRCLDLSAMSARPMLLKNIASFLPHLHTFRVKLALRHTLHYAFTGIRLLTGLSTVLNSFPELEILDLSPTGVGGVGRADSLAELAICQEWQRGCPSLRRIIFPSQTEFVLDMANGTWSMVTHQQSTGLSQADLVPNP